MSTVIEGRQGASPQSQREQTRLSDGLLTAIQGCVPSKKAEVRARLFRLAQVLRAVPDVSDNFELLRRCFREWCRLCNGVEIGGLDSLWAKFLDGWDRVVFPAGTNPAEDAWLLSVASIAPEAERFSEPEVIRLVSWFYELQKLHLRGAIYISSHKAAEKLGVPEKKVWEWQGMLEKESILKCVLRGKARVFCTRYRYVSLVEQLVNSEDSSDWNNNEVQEPEVDDDGDEAEEFLP